jgi:hypothetical protein
VRLGASISRAPRSEAALNSLETLFFNGHFRVDFSGLTPDVFALARKLAPGVVKHAKTRRR